MNQEYCPVVINDEWKSMPLIDQLHDIEHNHHRALRKDLPEISRLIDMTLKDEAPSVDMIKCREVFQDMKDELLDHIGEEEKVLFPMIRKLLENDEVSFEDSKTIEGVVHVLEYEHNHSDDRLREIREITNDYEHISESLNEYNELMDRLKAFEIDLHVHAYKENRYLYPSAIKKERDLLNKGVLN